MSERASQVTKGIGAVFGVAVIFYIVAILLMFAMIIMAEFFQTLFPAVLNPFEMLYNGVRSLVLFFMLLPLAIGLLTTAFVIDLITSFAYPFIHGILPELGIGTTGTDVMSDATTLVTTISDLIDTIFPVLDTSA